MKQKTQFENAVEACSRRATVLWSEYGRRSQRQLRAAFAALVDPYPSHWRPDLLDRCWGCDPAWRELMAEARPALNRIVRHLEINPAATENVKRRVTMRLSANQVASICEALVAGHARVAPALPDDAAVIGVCEFPLTNHVALILCSASFEETPARTKPVELFMCIETVP